MTVPDPVTRPSIRVVEAVAEKEGVPATELDCLLAEELDPQALDCLFHSQLSGSGTTGYVRFSYCGYTVVVEADGTVEVE